MIFNGTGSPTASSGCPVLAVSSVTVDEQHIRIFEKYFGDPGEVYIIVDQELLKFERVRSQSSGILI